MAESVPGRPKISLVVASYLNAQARRLCSLLALAYSIRAQDYDNWELLIIHDGEITDPSRRDEIMSVADRDPRIRLIETTERKGHYGHPWRHWGALQSTGSYIGFSNDDNYYAPCYFSRMLSGLVKVRGQIAFCDMTHSHRGWEVIRAKPARKFIDAGNWIATSTLVRSVPWTDFGFAGDWTYFQALKAKAKTVIRVPGVLFVHN